MDAGPSKLALLERNYVELGDPLNSFAFTRFPIVHHKMHEFFAQRWY